MQFVPHFPYGATVIIRILVVVLPRIITQVSIHLLRSRHPLLKILRLVHLLPQRLSPAPHRHPTFIRPDIQPRNSVRDSQADDPCQDEQQQGPFEQRIDEPLTGLVLAMSWLLPSPAPAFRLVSAYSLAYGAPVVQGGDERHGRLLGGELRGFGGVVGSLEGPGKGGDVGFGDEIVVVVGEGVVLVVCGGERG